MNRLKVQEMLISHEGMKFTPYRCTAGRLTIGVGRNISDKGITKEEAIMLLNNDISECKRDLANLVFKGQFYKFPEPVQHVLMDMRFQLGWKGFRGFRKMIIAFKELNYEEAIVQMMDSAWYGQTTNRANELIEMIREVIE